MKEPDAAKQIDNSVDVEQAALLAASATGSNDSLARSAESVDDNRKPSEDKPALDKKGGRSTKPKSKKNSALVWGLKIFFITLLLSFLFSFISELVVNNSHIAIAILLVVLLICIGVVFDMVAVAFTSCDIVPFHAMSARKIKGAKKCVRLLRNAEKVANICSDIIGDICGIISGSAGAVIALYLARETSGIWPVLFAIITSSLIAAFTVGGKALAKGFAITNAGKIVLAVGRLTSVFSRQK